MKFTIDIDDTVGAALQAAGPAETIIQDLVNRQGAHAAERYQTDAARAELLAAQKLPREQRQTALEAAREKMHAVRAESSQLRQTLAKARAAVRPNPHPAPPVRLK